MMGNTSTHSLHNPRSTAGRKMKKCPLTKGKQHLFDEEPVGIPESKPARSVSPSMSGCESAVRPVGQHEQMPEDFCGSSTCKTIVCEKPESPKVNLRKEDLLASAAAAAVRCMLPRVSDDDLWAAFQTFCPDASDTTHPLLSQRLLEGLARTDSGSAGSDDNNNDNRGVINQCSSSLCCKFADCAVNRPSTCSTSQDRRPTNSPVENTEDGQKSRDYDNGVCRDSKCVDHNPEAVAGIEQGGACSRGWDAYFAQFSVEHASRLEDHSEPLKEVQSQSFIIASSPSSLLTNGERTDVQTAAASRYKAVLAENKRLKRRQLCRLCKTQAVNATLLPCGHFVYCLECAQTLQHCGVCDKEILGDVRTFLS